MEGDASTVALTASLPRVALASAKTRRAKVTSVRDRARRRRLDGVQNTSRGPYAAKVPFQFPVYSPSLGRRQTNTSPHRAPGSP